MDIEQAQEATSMVPTMTVENVTEKATSWFDSIKQALKIDSIEWTPQTFLQVGLLLIGGFLGGFFLKRYSSYVLMLLIALGGLWILHEVGIVSVVINATRIQEIFGISTETLHASPALFLWGWIKDNLFLSICGAIGFIAGLKLS